jgi:hypothetical protein
MTSAVFHMLPKEREVFLMHTNGAGDFKWFAFAVVEYCIKVLDLTQAVTTKAERSSAVT